MNEQTKCIMKTFLGGKGEVFASFSVDFDWFTDRLK